jgi:hypothetical protein
MNLVCVERGRSEERQVHLHSEKPDQTTGTGIIQLIFSDGNLYLKKY